MSYILEALKKAQAERQLGATPTIHAPTLDVAAARSTAAGTPWKPLALAVAAAFLAGAAVLVWLQQTAPAAPAASPAAAPAVVAAAAPGNVVDTSAAQAGQGSASPAPAVSAAPVAPTASSAAAMSAAPVAPPASHAPAAAVPPAVAVAPAVPAAAPVAAATRTADPAPSLAASRAAAHATTLQAIADPEKPATAAKPAKPTPAPVAEVAEEPVQLLRELPEPIQRSVPPITMGGYMYSKNPADRLVLIDKILRREGEEVAPGLVLEKLLPKAAIFTFKGYRYRVPY